MDGCRAIANRFLHLPLAQVSVGAMLVSHGVLGVEANGFSVVADCLIEIALSCTGIATSNEVCGGLWLMPGCFRIAHQLVNLRDGMTCVLGTCLVHFPTESAAEGFSCLG